MTESQRTEEPKPKRTHGGARRGKNWDGSRPSLKRKQSFRERYPTWPLEFFMSVLNDSRASPEERFQAAKEALPYVHPRLAAIQVRQTAQPENALDLSKLNDDELAAFEAICAKAQVTLPAKDTSPKMIGYDPTQETTDVRPEK